MRPYLHKACAIGFLVFVALWIVGVASGLTLRYPPAPPLPISISGDFASFSSRNYSANNLKQIGLTETPLPLVLDNPNVDRIRVFEKTAKMTTGTSEFDKHETALRSAIKEYQASVFNEKSAGIGPHRRLDIEIGVHPDRFDHLVAKLKEIGTLASITVEQKDRTSEFRKLFAQRQSLKAYLEAMTKLRDGKSLSFDESLRLEQKMQDLEKELQALGVQFGDLLGAESYYHVHLAVVEYQPGDRREEKDPIAYRIFHGFVWALAWWLVAALAAAVIGASLLSVWVLRQKAEAGAN